MALNIGELDTPSLQFFLPNPNYIILQILTIYYCC